MQTLYRSKTLLGLKLCGIVQKNGLDIQWCEDYTKEECAIRKKIATDLQEQVRCNYFKDSQYSLWLLLLLLLCEVE